MSFVQNQIWDWHIDDVVVVVAAVPCVCIVTSVHADRVVVVGVLTIATVHYVYIVPIVHVSVWHVTFPVVVGPGVVVSVHSRLALICWCWCFGFCS